MYNMLKIVRPIFVVAPNLTLLPRCITTKVLNQQYVNRTENKSETSGFVPVYKFPYIRIFGLVNRLKVYQTALTLLGIPLTVALSASNLINQEAVYVSAAIGVTGCIVLYTAGVLTDKFIGFLYINEKMELAKISYVNFWGIRTDIITPLDDIIPFSDMPESITDGLYLKFCRYSVKKPLRINIKYGQILNKEAFKKIFIKGL